MNNTVAENTFGLIEEVQQGGTSSQSDEDVRISALKNGIERKTSRPEVSAGSRWVGLWPTTDVSEQSMPFLFVESSRGEEERERFKLLEKWEGVVLRVTGETFWARLADLTGDAPEEEAEFPLEVLSPQEMEWLAPGNVFYWTIGYRDTPRGRKLESEIRFRRVPGPGKREIERAQQEAAKIADAFGWK